MPLVFWRSYAPLYILKVPPCTWASCDILCCGSTAKREAKKGVGRCVHVSLAKSIFISVMTWCCGSIASTIWIVITKSKNVSEKRRSCFHSSTNISAPLDIPLDISRRGRLLRPLLGSFYCSPANPCQPMPIYANQCQPMPIYADLCLSICLL